MNVFQKIGLLSGTVTVVLTSVFGYIYFKESKKLLADLDSSSESVRLQGTVDMMHDAIRSDILALKIQSLQAEQLDPEDLGDLEEHIALLTESLDRLESDEFEPAIRALIPGVRPDVQQFLSEARTVAAELLSGRDANAAGALFDRSFTALEPALAGLSERMVDITDAKRKNAESSRRTSLNTMFVLLAAGGLLSVALYYYLAIRLPAPIIAMLRSMNQVSLETVDGAGQLEKTADFLSQGASQQAAAVEEMMAGLNEINAKLAENASSLEASLHIGEETRKSAEVTRERVSRLSAAMSLLNESSRRMAALTKTIDHVSFQTNILALNASVEAARAGNAGQGFAVVADEVRNLARRTSDSAREIESSISASLQQISTGYALSTEVEQSLHESASQIVEVESQLAEVTGSFSAQKSGLQEFLNAIRSIEKTIQQTAAAAEESAALVKQMTSQALRVKSTCSDMQELLGFRQTAG